MPHSNPTISRRAGVGLGCAALVAASLAVPMPAQAQALRAGIAPMASHAVAPQDVRARGGAVRVSRGARPGMRVAARPGVRPVVRPGPGRPGWAGPGVRPPPPGWHAAWGQPYWRNGGWYYRNNTGAWIAAGIAGAAIGAAAVGAANSAPYDDAVAYCMQRFRSYNPATGTYTGYDGMQYACP